MAESSCSDLRVEWARKVLWDFWPLVRLIATLGARGSIFLSRGASG